MVEEVRYEYGVKYRRVLKFSTGSAVVTGFVISDSDSGLRKSGYMRFRSKGRSVMDGEQKFGKGYVYYLYVLLFDVLIIFDNNIFFNSFFTGCRQSDWGMWFKGSISVDKVFIYWGCKRIVK